MKERGTKNMRATLPAVYAHDVSYTLYAGAPWRPQRLARAWRCLTAAAWEQGSSEREWPRCPRRVEAPMGGMWMCLAVAGELGSLRLFVRLSAVFTTRRQGGRCWRAICTGVGAAGGVESICPASTSGTECAVWRRLLRDAHRSVWCTTSLPLSGTQHRHHEPSTTTTRCCSATDAASQRRPRAPRLPHHASRATSTRAREHAIHQGNISVVGPARGLYAALSIAHLSGPADHGVIHNTCGPAMRLRYLDSACIDNANVTPRCTTAGWSLPANACALIVSTASSLYPAM